MLDVDQIKSFLASRGATHMPYPVPGGPFLFCDATGNGGWRAMRWDGVGDAVPLMDAPPAGGSQCTPCGVMVDGALAWSVCATYPGAFAVHTSAGEITPTKGAGYELPVYRPLRTKKLAVPQGYMKTFVIDGDRIYGVNGARQILAATPTTMPGVLLTTYTPSESNKAFHVTESGVVQVTLPDGSHPYKPAFHGSGLWHARKVGDGWEDRRIEHSPAYETRPVSGFWDVLEQVPTLRQLRGGA